MANANVRSLADLNPNKDDDEKDDKRITSSFTGGEKSGLAVQNPVAPLSDLPPGSRKVTLYKNGFAVDGGDFRPFGTPENDRFLAELKQGYAPKELQEASDGKGPVHIALNDKHNEEFASPAPPKYSLFSGDGFSLSGSGGGTSASSSSAAPVDVDKCEIQVDSSKPTTGIQIRFHDGQRRRITFNVEHTVSDLHNIVMQCAPVDQGYMLLAGFPPREITADPSTTLKDAGLVGQMITQKIG